MNRTASHNRTIDSKDPQTREFYLPGTFQFAHGPGWVERRLTAMVRVPTDKTTVRSDDLRSDFYLPATPAVRRRRPIG